MDKDTTSDIALKEWEIVCNALTSGQQHLIFRKGGIHEGREGFSFKHDTFALFPTHFHTQAEHVTVAPIDKKSDWQQGDEVTINYIAQAIWATTLTEWPQVKSLANYHIYSEQTLSNRFHWEGKGMPTGSIHVALVRVYQLPTPHRFLYAKPHSGCRSWINIPEYSTENITPVIPDVAFTETKAALSKLVR